MCQDYLAMLTDTCACVFGLGLSCHLLRIDLDRIQKNKPDIPVCELMSFLQADR